MKTIKVKDRTIGHNQKCFIIAEMGSNHDGSLDQAKELIDVAARAKCDAIKIQFPIAREAYPPGRKFGGFYEDQEIASVIKKNEVPEEWVPELTSYAKKQGLFIGASTDGFIGYKLIEENDFDFVKIPSFTISNIPLLKKARQSKIPWFLSTGVHSLGQIEEALDAVGPCPVALLHCISAYPVNLEDLNLSTIPLLRKAFDVPVGFSDHSLDPVKGPALAIGLNACLLEKHFTLNRELKGTDHFFALEPEELKTMVDTVRRVETDTDYRKEIVDGSAGSPLFGKSRQGLFNAELKVKECTELGIYLLKSMKKGQVIQKEDVRVFRCADTQPGLHPRYMDIIVGAELVRKGEAFEPLNWNHFIKREKI